MTPTKRKAMLGMAAMALVATTLSGCKFFDIGNPLLPKARFIAEPAPSKIVVTYDYRQSQGLLTATVEDAAFNIFSFPNDGTPGVYIHSYSAEYFDMNGKPIPTLYLAKTNFGVSKYVPPASSGSASQVEMQLPVYNQQVRLFGDDLAYNFAGGVALNRNFSHTINAAVTLYGEDDNFNQVEIRMSVPIQFMANISQ